MNRKSIERGMLMIGVSLVLLINLAHSQNYTVSDRNPDPMTGPALWDGVYKEVPGLLEDGVPYYKHATRNIFLYRNTPFGWWLISDALGVGGTIFEFTSNTDPLPPLGDWDLSNVTLSVALPIELIDFWGKSNGRQTEIFWRTASETNNAGFELQRSTNGFDFQTITWIKGQGSTTQLTDYTYQDKIALENSEVIYYRLKQVDLDGKLNYSDVISLSINSKQSKLNQIGLIYPNPVQDQLVWESKIGLIEVDQVSVLNEVGQLLWQNDKKGTIDYLKINSSTFSDGVYYLHLKLQSGENLEYIFVK